MRPTEEIFRAKHSVAIARRENFSHCGQQLGSFEGLKQRGDGLKPRVQLEFLLRKYCGRHDYRQVHASGMDLLDHLNARQVRHKVVSDDEIIMFALNRLPTRSPVRSGFYVEPSTN